MCFNSIKVQLEPAFCSLPCAAAKTGFNSIKVQLERSSQERGGRGERCFNSIKVQLEQQDELHIQRTTGVSIP